jgi:hypothetical protein
MASDTFLDDGSHLDDHHPYMVLPSDNYDEKIASRDYSDTAMEEKRKCIDAARATRIAMRASTTTSASQETQEEQESLRSHTCEKPNDDCLPNANQSSGTLCEKPNDDCLPNAHQSSGTFSLPFTLQKAHRLRGRGGPGCYHDALRKLLQRVSASDGMRPLRIEVSDELPWREYIASHASYDSLIGTGVEDFFLQFRMKSDPNRGGKSRLDFVIKRCDGSHVLLHPGTKRNNDARPIWVAPGEFESLI